MVRPKAPSPASVAAVPTTYKYTLYHSVATARQQNGIYNATFVNGSRYTVGTSEGITVQMDAQGFQFRGPAQVPQEGLPTSGVVE